MTSNAVLFLARRYLRAKRSFVSIITVISVVGVLVGVLMMIVVNAVMQGFELEFRQALIGYQAHLLLRPEDAKPAAPAAVADLVKKLRAREEIASAAAYAGGIIYLEREGAQTATELYGLPEDGGPQYLAKITKHRLDGEIVLRDGGIVISDMQSSELGARPGDRLAIYSGTSVTQALRKYRTASDLSDEKERHAAYKGIKVPAQEIGLLGYTRSERAGYYAYTTMTTAQRLFGLGEGATGVIVELRDPNTVKELRIALEAAKIIPAGWKATLWTDVGDARLAAMSNERFMMFFIIGIIGLVATFAVMNTTITVTTQKRREIGVLASLGMRQWQIVRIFVTQAAVVGVLGTLAGLGTSALVLRYRNEIRTLMAGGSADEGMFLSTIPAHIDPVFITCTCVGSVLLCLAAALPPAWLASRVDPAVALRD